MRTMEGVLRREPGYTSAEVESLRIGETVRAGAEDLDHIRSLIEDVSSWGAVLVRRSDGR
jgi:hypothetical protein